MLKNAWEMLKNAEDEWTWIDLIMIWSWEMVDQILENAGFKYEALGIWPTNN